MQHQLKKKIWGKPQSNNKKKRETQEFTNLSCPCASQAHTTQAPGTPTDVANMSCSKRGCGCFWCRQDTVPGTSSSSQGTERELGPVGRCNTCLAARPQLLLRGRCKVLGFFGKAFDGLKVEQKFSISLFYVTRYYIRGFVRRRNNISEILIW